MPKHHSKVPELIGLTPIATVTDPQVWRYLVTPQVRALLGPITHAGEPQVTDSIAGFFPGDEVSNLNDHRLFGGSDKYTRYPYISTLYRTAYGALVIKRDFAKIKALGWIGDVMRGKGEFIYKAALRDRRFDGTLRANDSPLLDFPYDDPKYNLPLPGGVSSLEVSIYGFMPGSRIAALGGELEFENFVANPFTFLGDPEKFLTLFNRAFRSQRAPGMVAAPIIDVSKIIGGGFDTLARFKKYDFVEDAASHYHVAMFAQSIGYRPTYADQAENLRQLTEAIARVKAAGHQISRPQESWLCALQSLRPVEMIPEKFYFGGPYWQQDNISQENLWMNKPLSPKAAELMKTPIIR